MTTSNAGEAGAGRLALRLAAFLIVGGAATLVVWYALHHLLAGTTPDISVWLVAAAGAVFAALVFVLKRRTAAATSGEDVPEEERAPVGTLFVLMVYIMILAGMWGTMYWILLRS